MSIFYKIKCYQKKVDRYKKMLYTYLVFERSEIMAVKLRLTRMGSTKRPFYRIVATDSRTKRDGEYIELIGTYNPLTNPADVKINEEVALKWLNTGAIPSDTVKNLLKEAGIMKKFAESKTKKAN